MDTEQRGPTFAQGIMYFGDELDKEKYGLAIESTAEHEMGEWSSGVRTALRPRATTFL